MRLPGLLLAAFVAIPVVAQPDAGRLVFTTGGAGVTTGTPDDPYGGAFLSASLSHTRTWGWRTLQVGGSGQAELLGNDRYGEVHVGAGGTASAGPLILTAAAGPSVAYGVRGVYGPGPVWPDGYQATVRLREREGLGVGLRATAQVVLVLAPELGLGVEATRDQTTLLPTSGVRLLLSLGTHRRSLFS